MLVMKRDAFRVFTKYVFSFYYTYCWHDYHYFNGMQIRVFVTSKRKKKIYIRIYNRPIKLFFHIIVCCEILFDYMERRYTIYHALYNIHQVDETFVFFFLLIVLKTMDLCIYGLVLLPQIRSEKQPQRSIITCDTIIGVISYCSKMTAYK